MHRGEVWWASLPEPTGSGPGARRPVLIVQANEFNASRIHTVIVAVITSNLRLSMWSFDDSLRPVRGQPTTVLVRDNGLDTKASAMLDAVRTFRPNLVKP